MWPHSPCAGREQLRVVPQPAGRAGYAWPASCTIEVDPHLDSHARCLTVIHELGHLAGLDHSADPRDVMAAPSRALIPACLAVAEPLTLRDAANEVWVRTGGRRRVRCRRRAPMTVVCIARRRGATTRAYRVVARLAVSYDALEWTLRIRRVPLLEWVYPTTPAL